MKMLPRRKAVWFYIALKKKPTKWKPEQEVPAESHTRCQQPRAELQIQDAPNCTLQLLPAPHAPNDWAGHTGRSGTEVESSKWIPCSQLAQMPQPLPKGLCLGWDRKAGPQLCYGQPQKTATTPLQCAVIPWCDISKPKLSSRSSFNFNVFYPSNQNNFFFNYL